MYSVYLDILAVKTVHRLDWVRSAGSVLILVVLGLLIVAVCVVAIFVPLFTTMMRNSF
jgi:type II secretory pathway component PulF